MKIQPECIPCMLRRSLFEIELATNDSKKREDAMLLALKTFAEIYDPSLSSAEIATRLHKAVYNAVENKDPYMELKKKSNEVALKLLPRVQEKIERSGDPLNTAMICSIIGNILDFGIEGGSKSPEDLMVDFEKYFLEGLGYDDYEKGRKIIERAKEIVFIADNCGEIVFDKLLCLELKKFRPGMKLTLVVRGEPILSDATIEEAMDLGFDEIVDNILTTGTFAVGLDIKNIPKDLKIALEKSDLIICKGMANYEALSETSYRPVLYLLRTKCLPVARSMGLPVGINAIKLFV